MINQKIQLTDDGKNLFPNPNLVVADKDNVIKSQVIPYNTWTDFGVAQEDCCVQINSNIQQYVDRLQISVDGHVFACANGYYGSYSIFVKKGQTIKAYLYWTSSNQTAVTFYGLKYI